MGKQKPLKCPKCGRSTVMIGRVHDGGTMLRCADHGWFTFNLLGHNLDLSKVVVVDNKK